MGDTQQIFTKLMIQVCALALLSLPLPTGGHFVLSYDRYYLA